MEGKVIDQPILTAYGVNTGEKREVLGISVSLSEAEVHWRTFIAVSYTHLTLPTNREV